VVGFGFSMLAIALTWLSLETTPLTPIWRLVLPITAMGVGMAFIWSPLAATATRNLPPQLAGAGSGVYNTTRQVGSVLGSASMAAFMTSRVSAEMPPMPSATPQAEGSVARLPAWLQEPFAAAMSQSMLLPAFFALFGVVAAMFLLGFGNAELIEAVDDEDADRDAGLAVEYGGDEAFVDDDEYVEYTVSWDEWEDDDVTEPLESRAEHVLPAPAETWHTAPVESWHWAHDEEIAEPEPPPPPPPLRKPAVEPIGFAHNGFHVDEQEKFQPLPTREPAPPRHGRRARHYLHDDEPEPRQFWFESNGRHSRDDPDDVPRYGRHSMPGRD
jgi:hypothetical protein